METFSLFLKGIFIGIANVIPGVSGGTMALILGIFDKTITAIKKIDLRFLVPLGLGVGGAIAGFSKIIPPLMEKYPSELAALFIGLILGSVGVPYKEMRRYGAVEAVFLLLGLVGGYAFVQVTRWGPHELALSPSEEVSVAYLVWLLLCGFLSTCAMILPGMSGSATLVLLGEYKTVFESVGALVDFILGLVLSGDPPDAKMSAGVAFVSLSAFGLGALAALTGFVRLLDMLLQRRRSQTMALLIGLMLGAMPGVWPERGGRFTLAGLALLLAGIALALLSEKLSQGKSVKEALQR